MIQPGDTATGAMCETDTCAFDLPGLGLAAQLRDDLDNLRDTGSAHRMALAK